jgi:hypothetical protein
MFKQYLSSCDGEANFGMLTTSEKESGAPKTSTHAVVLFEYFVCGYLILGPASGLEAFNREPPDDSIGALAVRQTPETSDQAWVFLSYYPILPSRYLRDPQYYLGNLLNFVVFLGSSCQAFQNLSRGPSTAPISLRANNLSLAIPG